MIREADLDRDGKVGMEDFMRTVVLSRADPAPGTGGTRDPA